MKLTRVLTKNKLYNVVMYILQAHILVCLESFIHTKYQQKVWIVFRIKFK